MGLPPPGEIHVIENDNHPVVNLAGVKNRVRHFKRLVPNPQSSIFTSISIDTRTVVITGCDGLAQLSRNLFENRPCITSPVDYVVGQFIS